MPLRSLLNPRSDWDGFGLVLIWAVTSSLLDIPNLGALDVIILIYGVFYFLVLPLLVRPYLRKTKDGATLDKELPYITIPIVLLGITQVNFVLLCIVGSFYYAILLHKVFYHSFHERSLINHLSPLKTVLFILPVPVLMIGIAWYFGSVFFPFSQFMEASFA